ncbi:MAG: class I SAM-dependent methyltransferase [Chloroflexi bacterium]|nr:class I SAM-dependent methyltransferase [Chloroflexota bacterium]MCI0783756.1 class I SAM-dependent methyltransferase [Chloroflexota bacterium]MCI0814903.1 class I SAM-dependent methyltransferase [Chloroflexota bacterium]MCI0817690.1 class I SAM-dependent methyltransferase [Chloroflexota bacterium]MCI0819877.1 class I SAM-dependent methyltransferase [Chloroflexota bacterium]
MPRQSVSFDRAASYYDDTRAMPAEAVNAITDAILDALARNDAGRLLEVGIGTGRISLPLMARGLPVTGVDISPAMTARLREKLTPEHHVPDLIFGDATHLPIRDGAFPAALTVHVLHLVSSAEATLAEIRRVLAPGGIYLNKQHRDNQPLAASSAWWTDALERRGHVRDSRLRFDEQRQLIRTTGASLELIDICGQVNRTPPGEVMDKTRNRIHSWTWPIPDDIFEDCLVEYEPWFRAHYPGEIVEELTHELEIWRWPA